MNKMFVAILVLVVVMGGDQLVRGMDANSEQAMNNKTESSRMAVFAGGCFWCMEADFEKVAGVLAVISGYTGGQVKNPTYKQVTGGGTGHLEAVKVIYDPDIVSYDKLVDFFWYHVDPTDAGGQFVDRGDQYRSAVFYANDEERRSAEASKQAQAASGRFDRPIVTELLPLARFYEAEEYHQDYYKKNPLRYRWYRSGSGRDRFLEKSWADEPLKMEKKSEQKTMTGGNNEAKYDIPSDAQLRQILTPLQYRVVRQDGTEPAYNNEYWDNREPGIYVDVVSGEPLFSSTDKFDSKTGWPSFIRTIHPDSVVEKKERSFFRARIEVRSKHADSHLGHLFNDGPEPTRLRYCINSAALRFIPAVELERAGYGQYRSLFQK